MSAGDTAVMMLVPNVNGVQVTGDNTNDGTQSGRGLTCIHDRSRVATARLALKTTAQNPVPTGTDVLLHHDGTWLRNHVYTRRAAATECAGSESPRGPGFCPVRAFKLKYLCAPSLADQPGADAENGAIIDTKLYS